MIYNVEQREKQSNTIKGAGNPYWKGGQIEKTCVRCGSPFLVYYNRKNTQTHCSLVCANRDMAEAQKGIVNPKKIHYGKNNGSWKGGPVSHKCAWCGKDFFAQHSIKRECCSRICAGKLQIERLGSPNYKDGRTPINNIIRNCSDYNQWRDAIFKRDYYTCRDCGKRGGYLEAHHLKSFSEYPELRFNTNNGKTLCLECHRKTFNKEKVLA